MRILLDSHAFAWFVQGDRQLSSVAQDAISIAAADVYVSAVTAWEMSTKVRLGKWPEAKSLSADLLDLLGLCRFSPLPISVEHALLAGSMPGVHKDPFDRMLAAQARIEGLTLVTADPAFRAFGTETLW